MAMNTGYAQSNAVPAEQKGTAVDSVNANIESITNRIRTLTGFSIRVVDGLIGAQPPVPETAAGPRALTLSTQEHVRDLELAFEDLSRQINRLG